MNVTFASEDEKQIKTHNKMVQYSDYQLKQDLATLEIKDGTNLSSKFLTLKYKKLAKIHHPDKKGGDKEAFQKLQNAFNRLTAMLDDGHCSDSEDDFEKEFFRTSNFPLEKKNCFVVILENKRSNYWEYVLKDLYGAEKILNTGGIQFKFESMALSFYNKPKKDNKTKVLIQGKNKDAIIEYVFETMPKIYRRVIEMGKVTELQNEKKDISCDNCDYKTKDIPIMQEHIELEHLVPYRKKIQQKLISAYKCDECNFSVPTRSSLRTHVNSKHKKQKQSSILRIDCGDDILIISPIKKKEETANEVQLVVNQLFEEILCKVCDSPFDNEGEIEKHLKKQHGPELRRSNNAKESKTTEPVEVESLFSCIQCDFDTDNSDRLVKHNQDNIHNVHNQNKTLEDIAVANKEDKKSDMKTCHLCSFEATSDIELDDHRAQQHGIINCDKCDYGAEDLGIMRKHKMEHTGTILFTCNICEFESSKQSILVDHKESKHSKPDNPVHECNRCEKAFSYPFLLKNHTCIPDFKYPCELCSFMATGLSDLLKHMDWVHSKTLRSCCKCDYRTPDQHDLNAHITNSHAFDDETKQKNVQNKFKCNQCSFSLQTEEELDIHKSTHVNESVLLESQPQRIKCDQCSYSANDVAGFVKHIREVHTAEHCRYCEYRAKDKEDLQTHMVKDHEELIILHSMARQVDQISERFEVFETFKEELADVIKSIAETQNAVKQELFLIRNKQAELSSGNNGATKPQPQVKPSVSPPAAPLGKESLPESENFSKPSKPSKPSPKPYSFNVQPPSHSDIERKTLFIGDSISGNVSIKKLEAATQSEFVTARAYSSVHDVVENVAKRAARYPKSNFKDVVPAQLKRDTYQTLILQAGSVDITNLNTKDNPEKHIEYFRQETVTSAKNFFQTGVDALSNSPSLEKVILLKQIPRYDPVNVDPLSIKPALSQLYNNTVTDLWMQSNMKDKLVIGNHNIDCTGSIKEARYRETKTGRFDGVHMFGSSGQKAYTLSVLNILQSAEITSPEFDFHQSCPQYSFQNRQGKQSQPGRNKTRNVQYQSRGFTLQTQNRFDSLPRTSQGNW